ncbi:MAG: SulP family inorganic anion transporter, partial [Sulfuricaulis sp.]|nr:SulP family inorganic anion transporter [Sulfuricaulis sp.]
MASVISPALIGMRLRRLLPFLNWVGEIKNSQVLRADLVAGITVALVLVPQSMAYAQLAGLPPYYGLYAAFLPPMVAALFGSSRQLATGPVAVVSLLTAAALEPIAATGSAGYVAYAITLSLLVGLFQLTLGFLRLGVVVNFLSHPVIIGFTNAAAIIIATSQLDKIFGVRIDRAEHHYETVWSTIVAIGHQLHWPTLLFGIGAFAIMIALRRFKPRIPNVLVAVAITTIISYFSGFEHLRTITVEQFESESVHEVIADQARLKQEIPELDRSVTAAEKEYQNSMAKHGMSDSRTLAAQHNLDTLKLKSERRIKTAKADLDEIRKQRFRYVPGPDGADGRFYHVGQVPDDAVTDKRLWRVRSLDGDKIILNGGGNVVGNIPEGLPTFKLPKFDAVAVLQLLSAAITISLIGFMEAISIAKAMATKTRHKLNVNQELIGQGLANIVGSVSMSYPTSGSFSRSAVNINAGA